MGTKQSLPADSDVVIVGGGIMGASAAYFLSTETDDEDVLLLEKDTIASGSTGDSSAIVRHHYGDQERYSRMVEWSNELYRQFEAETGQPIAYDENPMVRLGQTDGESAEYIEAGYDVMSSLDVPVTRYEGEEVTDAFPMISVDAVDFAVSDDTAAYSDGPDVANGFALAAQEAGADVLTDVAVTDFEVSDGSISGVVTDQGTVSTENVVLTAGPWTPRLTEKLGFDVPITRTREQILILEPGQQYEDSYDTEIPTTAPPGAEWYIRPDFGDGILVATHHSDDEVDPDHYKQNPDEDTILGLIDEIVDFVPDLEDADLQGQYCGIYSTTPDKDFVIDQAGPDGVYLGCGFSGHGFKHGPAVGKILSDLVTGGDTDLVDVGYFSLDRFEDDPAGHSDPDDAI